MGAPAIQVGAVNVQPIDFTRRFVEPDGFLAGWAGFALADLRQRAGGQADKVDAAYQLALGAVPQSTEVVAAGGLQGGGSLSDNVGVTLYLVKTTVALLPTTGAAVGDWAYALDGRKSGEGSGAGTGVPVFWSGGASAGWYAVWSSALVTA